MSPGAQTKTLPDHLAKRAATGLHAGEPVAQFEIGSLKNFVYLIVDWKDRSVWIVDPQPDLTPLRTAIKVHSLEPRGILLTHTHHDHVGGVPALVDEFPGIRIYVGERDLHRLRREAIKNASVRPLKQDEKITLGTSLTLQALLTPGHSAGEVCYFLAATHGHPPYLLTGDTVFIRDCGRTDFPDGSNEEMFTSLQRIRALPPETVILPGHHYQPECASTLERELRESPPFRCRTVAELASLP